MSLRRALAAALGLLLCLLLTPVAAQAASSLIMVSSFPASVAVGNQNVAASLLLTNANTAPDAALTVCNVGDAGACSDAGAEGITLLPSCGAQNFTLQCTGFDPNVFSVDPSAIGAAGTECANMPFSVTLTNVPNGMWTFKPLGGVNVVLPGAGSTCRIDFTFDVLKFPAVDIRPATSGQQTAQVPEALALSNIGNLTFARGQSNLMTVRGAPTIASAASAPVSIGGSISDGATLTGEYNPAGGAVTFTLYGPADATCSSAPAFSATVPVASDGTVTSPSFTPSTAGTYRWIAGYGGDANNDPASETCNAPNTTVTIAKATPSIATNASPAIVIGDAISDTATLGAEHNPSSGNVIFRAYGPSDATCSGTPAFTAVVAVNGDGTASSGPFTPTIAGTYRWIASYGGDVNNAATSGACNDAGGTVTVAKRSPSLQSDASAGIVLGDTVTDSATLLGEHNPVSGQVTFRLYGPADAACSGVPAFTSVITVSDAGTATSTAFTPAAPGTYRWIASYGGDANNNVSSGACNDAGATVTVAKKSPAVVIDASPAIVIGATVSASSTLTGRHDPTSGSVTFTLYGPGDVTCAQTPVFTSSVAIGPSGAAGSAQFEPTAPGTYRWIAAYGGDANNASAQSACADADASVVVSKASPSIGTSASPGGALGTAVSDSATLTGEHNPTGGTVTFRLYGPGDASCSATPVFSSTLPIATDGTRTSASFTPAAPGTYRWIADYSGDANNDAATGACNDPGETVTIARRTPAMTSAASQGVVIGATVTDSATLVGEHNPASGDVTFSAYGPADATCSGTAAFTSTVPIAGDGTATSAAFKPTAAGTYRWVARYAGDANNASADGACNDADETVTIAKASPALHSSASQSIVIGGAISDTATLSGEHNPTGGAVTFRLYGPADAACSGTAAFTSTTAVEADGSVISQPFTPTATGTYRWVASYAGDRDNEPASGACNDTGSTVTVTAQSPTLQTDASPGVGIGGAVSAKATLSGEFNPAGGNVTFKLYGPGDTTCDGVPVFTSTVAIGGGGSVTSESFTPTAPGTLRWVARYGGDANNAAATSACNVAGTSVLVSTATPSIHTSASPGVALGGAITDSAWLAGEHNPASGSVTFRLYGPDDATCSATPLSQTTSTIAADGTATSAPQTPTAPGTYRWVATYSGDANNDAAAAACNDPGESVTVAKRSATIASSASPAVVVGATITDDATLGGEHNPTNGNVSFRAYGPADPNCGGTPAFESTVAIRADGTATSGAFRTPAAGTYRWIAAYGGDADNAAAAGACNDADSTVTASKASPAIRTNASPAVAIGGSIHDTATLTGAFTPAAGSVTFRLYGPGDATCSSTPAFTATAAVTAAATATSPRFTPTVAGTYRWIAAYGGDADNNAASGACNDADELVVVGKASPRIATQPSPGVALGGSITNTARLESGFGSPTGKLTFMLYGPGDATCSGAPVFTTAVAVSAVAGATAAPFTPTKPGTYRWLAVYGGDANNGGAISGCDANAVEVSQQASPLLCGKLQVALMDVFPENGKMVISGVAQPTLRGQKVRIMLASTGKTVVTATVSKTGLFAATTKLPPKGIRKTARYAAKIAKHKSVALKLQRRSYFVKAVVRGDRLMFAGRVTGKFKAGKAVSIVQITLCTQRKVIASTKLSRRGTWKASIPVPDVAASVLFRASTTVLNGRKTERTFTLPRPASTSSAY